MLEQQAKTYLAENGWLAGEPHWLRDAIISCSTLQSYEAGELTHIAGDDPGGMFGIAAGSFGIMIPTGNSELTICHLLRTGNWFGIGPVLTKGPRSLTYKAAEGSRVLYASLADLDKIAAGNPEFFRRIGMLSEGSYYAMGIKILGDLLIPSSERRVAAVLSRLGGFGIRETDSAAWPIPLSQAEIGQMSNCSRDRVSRALQKFQKAGWISVDYKKVLILDRVSLSRLSQGD